MTKTATLTRIFPAGSTVVCAGGGPSLTAADLETCRGRVDGTIVVNNGYLLAPWADVLYAADGRWWAWHKGAAGFAGLKFSVSPEARRWPGVQILKQTGDTGLELSPIGLRTGRNSGYQTINLAVLLGAARILLLGYDMQVGPKGEQHWHGEHPNKSRSNYDIFRVKFKTLVEPLQAAGVTVINCSRRTALTAFPCEPLEVALTAKAA